MPRASLSEDKQQKQPSSTRRGGRSKRVSEWKQTHNDNNDNSNNNNNTNDNNNNDDDNDNDNHTNKTGCWNGVRIPVFSNTRANDERACSQPVSAK